MRDSDDDILKERTKELENLNSEYQKREQLSFKLSQLKQELLNPINLEKKLKLITDGVVTIFEADFARIWLVKDGDLCEQGCIHASVTEGSHVCMDRSSCLHLVVSSGRYTHINGNHRRVPLGSYKIGRIAAGDDSKFITNDVCNDPRVHDHRWAQDLGLVSFSGFKLASEDGKPIGVLALFRKKPLDHDSELLLEDLANTTSQVILAGNIQRALKASENKYRTLSESSTDSIYLFDKNLKYSYLNNHALKMVARKPDEIIGKGLEEVFPPEVSESMKKSVLNVFNTGETISVEKICFTGGRAVVEYITNSHKRCR